MALYMYHPNSLSVIENRLIRSYVKRVESENRKKQIYFEARACEWACAKKILHMYMYKHILRVHMLVWCYIQPLIMICKMERL